MFQFFFFVRCRIHREDWNKCPSPPSGSYEFGTALRRLTDCHHSSGCFPSSTSENLDCNLCPHGWKNFNSKCYYISKHRYNTWTQSKDYCTAHRAHLVIVDDEDEKLVRILSLSHVLFWVQGSQYSDKPCAYYDLSRNRWISAYCYQKFFWICETEAMELY
uniref:C-type lectin domain-containing protein n=1 Tax=Scleropages formosus TaxID=113540 RepID=A0A8C9VKQ2_SCLFO